MLNLPHLTIGHSSQSLQTVLISLFYLLSSFQFASAQNSREGYVAMSCAPYTQGTPFTYDLTEPVVALKNLSDPAGSGGSLGNFWEDPLLLPKVTAPAIMPADWNADNLGMVFGLAYERNESIAPDLFTAATAVYGYAGAMGTKNMGVAGPAGIYRLNDQGGMINGTWEVFFDNSGNNVKMAMSGVSSHERGMGYGQVAYGDMASGQYLYASNFDTGEIEVFRDNGSGVQGTHLQSWDIFTNGAISGTTTLDSTEPDGSFITRRRRVWGVQVHHIENRLYFSMSDQTNLNLSHKIFSVAIDPSTGQLIGIATDETPTGITKTQGHTQISDIAFSRDGNRMILVERYDRVAVSATLTTNTGGVHSSKAFHMTGGTTGSWSTAQAQYVSNLGSHTNAAGGIDFFAEYTSPIANGIDKLNPDGRIIVTSDSVKLGPINPTPPGYGFESVSTTDALLPYNDNLRYYVDADGDFAWSKRLLGDIESVPVFSSLISECSIIADATAQCLDPSDDLHRITFDITNNSPFVTPATTAQITPQNGTLVSPVPVNGIGDIILGTPLMSGDTQTLSFDVQASAANPTQVCFDVKLLANDNQSSDWCCPKQTFCATLHCPECAQNVSATCQDGGSEFTVSVFNPNTAPFTGVMASNTSGNGLNITSATIVGGSIAGNSTGIISLVLSPSLSASQSMSASLNFQVGGYNPDGTKTCCETEVILTHPVRNFGDFQVSMCPIEWVVLDDSILTSPSGQIFLDMNGDKTPTQGEDKPMPQLLITLKDDKGQVYQVQSDNRGQFDFGKLPEDRLYRLSVKPPKGLTIEGSHALRNFVSYRELMREPLIIRLSANQTFK